MNPEAGYGVPTKILERVKFPEPFDYEAIGKLVVAAMVEAHGGADIEIGKDGAIIDVEGNLKYHFKAQVTLGEDPIGTIWGLLCTCVTIQGQRCCVGPGCS
jgi:hypothetical protein